MALIKQTSFGGLMPSVSPRALPDAGAQVSNNLLASTQEFRPLQGDTTAVADTGVSDPLSMHRFARKADGSYNTDMGTGWIVSATEKNYAKTQINDDATERTGVTLADGSAPPRVIDVNGADRQMGVPRPAVPITMVVNVVDQFDAEDRDNSLSSISTELLRLNRDGLTVTWVGTAHPSISRPGLVDVQQQDGLGIGPDLLLRVYRLSSTGGANNGTIVDPFVPGADPSTYGWVFDGTLGGIYRTSQSNWPAWASDTGLDFWGVPMTGFGRAYTLNTDAYIAALRNIMQPGTDAPTRLLTEDQVGDLVGVVNGAIATKTATAAPKVTALAAQFEQVLGILNGDTGASVAAAYGDFYAGPGAAITDAALTNFAEYCWSFASQAAKARHVDGG